MTPAEYPTYNPFVSADKTIEEVNQSLVETPFQSPSSKPPTPTRASITIKVQEELESEQLLTTPTPDPPHKIPTPRQSPDEYIVQTGDTLGSIAQTYGVSVDLIMQANDLPEPDLLEVGTKLHIPTGEPEITAPAFKIIPDSEFVFGPASALFDIGQFIQDQHGYLADYSEDVNGELLRGDQIILRVSQNYSINPRLLLAILEHQSGWVTNAFPSEEKLVYPLGLIDAYRENLYLQLTWAANTLNNGFYLWRVNAVSNWVLNNGTIIYVDPTINAGTAGIQNLYSKLDNLEAWEFNIRETGLFLTYWVLFGNPFNFTIDSLPQTEFEQPRLSLPFPIGETWSFTGGPHGGWDSGSAWAALDFAPPGDTASCTPSSSWVTAVAEGLIVRAMNGAVIQDLDNDGYEQTGWVILYMHIDSNERVKPGAYLFTNESIGHPSCEGGLANGTHVHIARRYNGEWIPADGSHPFDLDSWKSYGNGIEYDGVLTRGDNSVEAWDGVNDSNQITR